MIGQSCVLHISERQLNRFVALISAMAFAYIAWVARSFPPPFNEADVGPAQLPTMAAVLGMLACCWLYWTARQLRGQTEIGRPLRVLSGVIAIGAYVMLMPVFGFYPTSFVAVAILMAASGEHRAWVLLTTAVSVCLFVYVCFDLILDVQFP
ncbi:tripartite tricarboxylate transporter TctB family protein [Bordetella sp. 15P40C-2]|uniref:tripartite tricarboxylate transporter TctB family protein n=1 Tax=Bordetella sp. 15P40C-2 TaxID=2572246 RepID=UPI0013223246|nr:tripartite tricarboxylate transporter TctB family protein [Bordetella sp. 15P40C-2]MVW72728.1 hypothetical protein [Bordetella sp. 15P40C-2]